MISHPSNAQDQVRNLIRQRKILLAGNLRLKIYGTLQCSLGKRMKKENRVFFQDEAEAIQSGFRPCGHCLREKYLTWKNEIG